MVVPPKSLHKNLKNKAASLNFGGALWFKSFFIYNPCSYGLNPFLYTIPVVMVWLYKKRDHRVKATD
ncbi:MAG: hypothetical protein DRR19_14545 [Candidatus Parabeggiatoa sp. nov. 1]|nr:MAG: hypothetical protein DRR19_14545 [Gammaproteobacteria bacterium]